MQKFEFPVLFSAATLQGRKAQEIPIVAKIMHLLASRSYIIFPLNLFEYDFMMNMLLIDFLAF